MSILNVGLVEVFAEISKTGSSQEEDVER